MTAHTPAGDPNLPVTSTGGSYVITTQPNTITTPGQIVVGGAGGSSWNAANTTWGVSSERSAVVECRFCDKPIEIGLIIQSKDGKKNNICIKCAKEYMGAKKIAKLLELLEPLAVLNEMAKT